MTGSLAVVPDWDGDDLKNGTIRGAVRQFGLTWEQFNRAEMGLLMRVHEVGVHAK